VYTPRAFEIDRDVADAIIDECDLASVVVFDPAEGFEATWLPLMRRPGRLVGHVAKANPLWRHTGAALAMFRTVDGYVSPNWYASKREHGKVVPTWNYVAVNVHGTLVAHHDELWKREVVTALTQRHEARIGSGWQVTDAPPDYITTTLAAIVGIEIVIERVEGKAKLSQNRSEADVAGVVAANDNALVDAMRRPQNPTKSRTTVTEGEPHRHL
jgi:transcriptional regulator